jgi:hypothetical protein
MFRISVATYCFVPLSVRRNFVVCPHDSFLKSGERWAKKVAEH